MMKKISIVLSLILFITFALAPDISAQMMGNYDNNDTTSSASQSQTEQQYQQNLQNLLNTLFQSQHVSSMNQLTCLKITNDQFEKIGDAWMAVRIGNETMHQTMDNMLGGEGSQSLTNAHIQMGQRYLGCETNGANYGWMPMMFDFQNAATNGGGNSMMGWSNYGYGYGNMMNGNLGWGFAAFHFLIALVVLVDFILVGIWLWQQISSHKRK